MAQNWRQIEYKFVLLGDSSVGKSSIFERLSGEKFSETISSTVGTEKITLDFDDVEIDKNENLYKNFKITLFDTAGQERYRAITSSYFKGSNGCFIVYDITNEASFNNIENWYEQIQKETSKDIPILLVGNKCDLEDERKVPIEKGKEKAQNLNCAFFETSALKKINIDKIFEELVNNIYEKTGGNKNDDDINVELVKDDKAVNLNEVKNGENEKKKGGCCGK